MKNARTGKAEPISRQKFATRGIITYMGESSFLDTYVIRSLKLFLLLPTPQTSALIVLYFHCCRFAEWGKIVMTLTVIADTNIRSLHANIPKKFASEALCFSIFTRNKLIYLSYFANKNFTEFLNH